ncbi:DNA recombination and repair protein RAD51 [Trypanosoma cruzi cruzi]|uniref:DNA repair protein RAD51 homolog 3 n=1 Tax=Trypanosoma cruzi TaxID=5693 RepID=A0A2V2W3T2_TRYCR|nr:DNA recombination and repair protein RAD51 [Trypanosoma cruzi]PBJ73528.1 DNA recombination and repair protein RAD51 [Trypanosoma cruzi cruzi]PWV02757.1 putative DNA recombination and repair protein RAD51 [Trypanosoma cruzi]
MMSVEHCSCLNPSLKARLQNAGLLWIDDICRLLKKHSDREVEGVPSQQKEGTDASLSSTDAASRRLLERCPQLTQAEAVEVMGAVLSLYRGNDPADSDYHIPPETRTLEEMLKLEADKESERVTTFCRGIDTLLGGGLPVGTVSEVCGPPGVGKTQMLMQLAVNCLLPRELGGLHGSCLFIDTEGSFVPERFREIAHAAVMQVKEIILRQGPEGVIGDTVVAADEDGLTVSSLIDSGSGSGSISALVRSRKRGRAEGTGISLAALAGFFTVDYVLQQTQYLRVMDVVSLVALLNVLPTYLASHSDVRMVVIDSIAFPFRSFSQLGVYQMGNEAPEGVASATSVTSKHLLWQRSRLLFRCGQLLQQHAREQNICVVVSNQVTSRTLSSESGECSRVLIPALGDSWAYGLSTRLLLKHQHNGIMEKETNTEREKCHENVVFIAPAVDGGFDVGSAVNAVQHRVVCLVKSPNQTRGHCCFSISQKGVRDIYRVWL